jgi:hypothetical protein
MGGFFGIFKKWFMNRETRCMMLGFDAAGKTTVLYKLKLLKHVPIISTVGFNVETIEYKGFNMNVWDVGGGNCSRAVAALLRRYAVTDLRRRLERRRAHRRGARRAAHATREGRAARRDPARVREQAGPAERGQAAEARQPPQAELDHEPRVAGAGDMRDDSRRALRGLDWLGEQINKKL